MAKENGSPKCSLDAIKIKVMSDFKTTDDQNLTLWLRKKPAAICAGYNWSIAIKELDSVILERLEQKFVVKFESKNKEKVWIGELILQDKYRVTAREQNQLRSSQLQAFVEVIQKLLGKQNPESRLMTTLNGPSSKFTKKAPSSGSRRLLASKYVSPTPRRTKSSGKKLQFDRFVEFSSDEEDNKGIKAPSQGMENISLNGKHSTFGNSFDDNDEFEECETFKSQPRNSGSLNVEMQASGPVSSNNLKRLRKRRVLQDDEEDDSVSMTEADNVSKTAATPSIDLEQERSEIDGKCVESDNDKEKKKGGDGIFSFFKPKVKMTSLVASVSPEVVSVSTAAPLLAMERATPKKMPDGVKLEQPPDRLYTPSFCASTPMKRKSPAPTQELLRSPLNTPHQQDRLIATTSQPTAQPEEKEECFQDLNQNNKVQSLLPFNKKSFLPKRWTLRENKSYHRLRDDEKDESHQKKIRECDLESEKVPSGDVSRLSESQESSAFERHDAKDTWKIKRGATVTEKSMVGLRNTGNSCYLNAALQMLFSLQASFVQDFFSFYEESAASQIEEMEGNKFIDDSKPADEKNNSTAMTSLALHRAVASVFYCMQRTSPPLFLDLGRSVNPSGSGNSASAFCIKKAMDLQTSSYHGNEQRDSHEFLLEMLDLLDDEERKAKEFQNIELDKVPRLITPMKGSNRRVSTTYSLENKPFSEHKDTTGPIEQYFKCEVEVKLVCDSCGYSRTKIEMYRHFSLDLTSDDDEIQWATTQGLEKFFQPHKVSVKCDKNGCEGLTCMKSQTIVRLPGALLLHLKRFKAQKQGNVDGSVGITFIKNSARVCCPTTLSLGPFCAPLKEKANDDNHSYCSTYKLKSIVRHIGDSANRGHYTTDALRSIPSAKSNSATDALRSPLLPLSVNSTSNSATDDTKVAKEKWVRFDDANTMLITADDAIADQDSMRNVYMMLYDVDKKLSV